MILHSEKQAVTTTITTLSPGGVPPIYIGTNMRVPCVGGFQFCADHGTRFDDNDIRHDAGYEIA